MRRQTRSAGFAILGLLLLAACASDAGRPVRDINAGRHPNLASAQDLCQRAFDKVTAAQQANEWDMGGHAQHAKELIGEASSELKLAAESASHRH